MFVKHQVTLKFHFLDWTLKPIYLNQEVEQNGLAAKVVQFTFLFFTFRNLKYRS